MGWRIKPLDAEERQALQGYIKEEIDAYYDRKIEGEPHINRHEVEKCQTKKKP